MFCKSLPCTWSFQKFTKDGKNLKNHHKPHHNIQPQELIKQENSSTTPKFEFNLELGNEKLRQRDPAKKSVKLQINAMIEVARWGREDKRRKNEETERRNERESIKRRGRWIVPKGVRGGHLRPPQPMRAPCGRMADTWVWCYAGRPEPVRLGRSVRPHASRGSCGRTSASMALGTSKIAPYGPYTTRMNLKMQKMRMTPPATSKKLKYSILITETSNGIQPNNTKLKNNHKRARIHEMSTQTHKSQKYKNTHPH